MEDVIINVTRYFPVRATNYVMRYLHRPANPRSTIRGIGPIKVATDSYHCSFVNNHYPHLYFCGHSQQIPPMAPRHEYLCREFLLYLSETSNRICNTDTITC